jgi:hypothetical protein
MTKRSLAVAAVFLAGCAVGGASSQLAVPKASAQQAATLTKWEHYCWIGSWHELPEAANNSGAQGWEMVNFTRETTSVTACYKRPKM